MSITDSIRAAILGGEFAPGVRLVELQLAERYGASRASVRGAISELEKEGLVDREANRGATVRRVSIDEALQITEVRGLLEGLAASGPRGWLVPTTTPSCARSSRACATRSPTSASRPTPS